MTRFVSFLTFVLALSSCGSDPASADGGNGMCQCKTQTALETPYDHATSMLGAANVQDGIDELAARPVAEMPVGPRLEMAVVSVDNTGSVNYSPSASCPDAAHDFALGGTCGPLTGATLLGSTLLNSPTTAGLQCTYQQTAGATEKAEIRVSCLHKAK